MQRNPAEFSEEDATLPDTIYVSISCNLVILPLLIEDLQLLEGVSSICLAN